MDKPTIYIETTIPGILYYDSGDIVTIAHRLETWDWWDSERRHFKLYSSHITEAELRQGVYRNQPSTVALIRRIPHLPDSATVKGCAAKYLEAGIVPATKEADAAHLAFAAVHGMDYLLSWNQAHLSNPLTYQKLEVLNARLGWRTPLLCSPATMPRVAMGQTIRRRP